MILGIDPGVNGGVALVRDGTIILLDDVPTSGTGTRRRVASVVLADMLAPHAPLIRLAYVEDVHSRPRQGVASTFKFGEAVGTIHGVLGALGIPVERLAPTVWKKHYRLRGGDDGKEDARRLAIERWPSAGPRLARKLDHNRAEALLIAMYGERQ